jgi:hypothetical protein
VKLERIRPIAVCGVLLEVFGEINNVDGLEGALLDTNTTACRG